MTITQDSVKDKDRHDNHVQTSGPPAVKPVLSDEQCATQPRPSGVITPFPTLLSHLTPPPTHTSIYTHLHALRTSTLSIHNRLTSILSDSDFVQQIAKHYSLPLIANERCGSWYIPPSQKDGSVYFKSTDGHHGQWDFSLRRLNLHLLRIMGERGGAVVVDSTRRGKSVPDSLAKTVVGWVSVVNRVLWSEVTEWAGLQDGGKLEAGERWQIEQRVEGWCKGFKGLGLDLEELRREGKRPIRIRWAVNGEKEEEEGEQVAIREDVSTLVLCSASRRVRGAEASEGGYVQGSGDDHEGWSFGMTPQLFWRHQDVLLKTPESELPDLIERLVKEDYMKADEMTAICIKETSIFVGARGCDATCFDLVVNCHSTSLAAQPQTLNLCCRERKLGSKDLREKLPIVKAAAETCYTKSRESRILVTCDSGKDLSVGVALALLCLFHDADGSLSLEKTETTLNKHLIKQRLAWISSVKPDANPSRATLQAVNTFLIGRPE